MIYLLKTIGLSNFSLIRVFMSIGLLIGMIGTSLGGILGIVFSLNISSIQFDYRSHIETKVLVELEPHLKVYQNDSTE